MRCDDAHPLLQDAMDDLLLPLDRAAIEQHVASCRSCETAIHRLRSLARALDRLPPAEAPAGFARRVMDDLPEMLPAKEGMGHVLRWGMAAAAATVAFVALLALLPAAGPGVAEETFRSLVASAELGGSMVLATALLLAGLLDAAAVELAAADAVVQLAACVTLFGTAALLALSLRRYERLEAAGPAEAA